MIDRTEKPKIPSKFAKHTARYNEFGYVGANFYSFYFLVFSLTCYRVFFFFSLSGILLMTLLCYVLYVNFVIVCYLFSIAYQRPLVVVYGGVDKTRNTEHSGTSRNVKKIDNNVK